MRYRLKRKNGPDLFGDTSAYMLFTLAVETGLDPTGVRLGFVMLDPYGIQTHRLEVDFDWDQATLFAESLLRRLGIDLPKQEPFT